MLCQLCGTGKQRLPKFFITKRQTALSNNNNFAKHNNNNTSSTIKRLQQSRPYKTTTMVSKQNNQAADMSNSTVHNKIAFTTDVPTDTISNSFVDKVVIISPEDCEVVCFSSSYGNPADMLSLLQLLTLPLYILAVCGGELCVLYGSDVDLSSTGNSMTSLCSTAAGVFWSDVGEANSPINNRGCLHNTPSSDDVTRRLPATALIRQSLTADIEAAATGLLLACVLKHDLRFNPSMTCRNYTGLLS